MQSLTPLALVTGASSGIGLSFARRRAARGDPMIVVGRRQQRLDALAAEFPAVNIRPVVADLASAAGIAAVAELCRREPLTLLINNAGGAHYMPFTTLPPEKASELLQVKCIAPTLVAHAAVAGMLAFGATAPPGQAPGRAIYVATISHLVSMSLALHEELGSAGLRVQALCPSIVATEFHERQGMDLSALARMSADNVVTASLRALDLGEVLCAPGVENATLLANVFKANLAAFGAQSPQLAARYDKRYPLQPAARQPTGRPPKEIRGRPAGLTIKARAKSLLRPAWHRQTAFAYCL
ncbi:Oxidoreductase short chain dehydrogenase/reductase family [Candidatus Sodalis pierantonius str. SOPE]|uniref:Oxidoreductase short chain dehydrogenase/reductase family n=1 Tax=Candidatus Sodalis pierantonii str. SOPE TaxID=2342 RepID=W0HJW3_9GAMM|nr:SDR family NAD(P)-dependent oxidoreductase [Candidatus Sodalis pierantonius]AHF74084.1 Oxidoreductase short chain dehydrogenase/reductase family [Candidatus Sodalis pierantonius str. SOPE]